MLRLLRSRAAAAALGAALVSCLLAGPASALPPTVNGLFFGDGDDARYQPYATSNGGSVLYFYFDVPTSRLYVALVVSHSVNDMVCSPQNNNAYTQSAGWGNHRSCKRASDSEFASFTLQCAPNSPNSWSWQQALGCNLAAGPPQSGWLSNSTCTTSAGTWPPSIVSSTSWVANVNTYQTNPTPAWNMYAAGTDINDWKSPFLAASPNNATLVPGYPTYSGGNYRWEWSMVYEWSVNLGPAGTNCGNQPIWFITGVSHHSPAKNGSENDSFPPPSGDPILADWGDLPASYGTTLAANGPRHHLKVGGPYLGTEIQAERDGQPTTAATGDGSEEDGVTAVVTGNWEPGTNQTVLVTVGNAGLTGATLGGWFDWNGDGDVVDAGEFFSWNVINGVNILPLTVGDAFAWEEDDLYSRFRIFSAGAAAPGGSLGQTDFVGLATDGEVEDHVFLAGALPVSVNAFSSTMSGGETTVRWQTASETDNVGFEVWGLVRGEWQPLGDLVPSQGMNSALPQSYEARVATPAGLAGLRLVDYDSRGRAEQHGPFRLAAAYGEEQPVRKVDWSGPRAERERRLAERGFETPGRSVGVRAGGAHVDSAPGPGWKKLARGGAVRGATAASGRREVTIPIAAAAKGGKGNGGKGDSGAGAEQAVVVATGTSTHAAVTTAGVQRVTYEALRDGGLDLAGVRASDVAVTWRGAPVARWIDGPATFGAGSAIEFLGRPPQGDDALYVDAALYQVAVDPARVREAQKVGRGNVKGVSPSYQRRSTIDRQLTFHPQSPTGDPWIERSLLVRGAATLNLDLPVEGPVLPGRSRLTVGLGAISDLADKAGPGGQPLPEHNVEVWLAPPGGEFVRVATASASGQRDWTIEADLPAGLLQSGLHRLQLRFSTSYFFSLVVVDRYGVEHAAPYRGPALDFAPDPAAQGYLVDGFASPNVVVYGEEADGGLSRIDARVAASGGGWAAEIRKWTPARFWVTDSPHAPAMFTTEAPDDLLSGAADLVVIAGSSFVGTQALDDYLAQTAAFRPLVVDVEDVYNAVGFGMALPSAITDYLAARHAVSPFTHVQLVGTDCYDRLSYISSCISAVPLPTAAVGPALYSPSQNRLVDRDGDGVGDVAVAQFSVRAEAELATIVRKNAAWQTSGLAAAGSALLIAEEGDGVHSFIDQVTRLRDRMSWSDVEVLDMSRHPSVATARAALGGSLAAGRSVTVFSGHSSPTVWAYRSLLTTGTVPTLRNGGLPTLMVPLACETTYDVSPNANVLGHQLLYAGDHGAVAISGAVALSSLAENERMARHVLDGLAAGLTLGEAVQAGRRALGSDDQELLDNWMTQGDVTVAMTP